MAVKQGAFPYDIDNLLGGAVRILFADLEEASPPAIPDSIDDVVAMSYPYAPKTGWLDLGATKESFTYSRGFETEGWEIQQEQGNVIEEVTSISRTIELSLAEFRPETLQLMENAPNATTVAAATGISQQKRVGFGSFQSPHRYRFAFISRRSTASGIVTEGSGGTPRTRGRFFMGVLYQAQIAADDISLEQSKGALTAAGLTFTAFPDALAVADEEYGAWYDEQAGTLALS